MCTAEDILKKDEQNFKGLLTRQCNKVLKCLYKCKLNNKDLAKRLGVSASALSNILQKIKNVKFDLLIIEQIGRNTYYSLSEQGQDYVEHFLMNTQIINIEEKVSNSGHESIAFFHHMKNMWGEEWKLIFEEVLLDYTRGEVEKADSTFVVFIRSIEKLFIEERWEELNTIYELLEEELFQNRIEKYFERIMGIKCLCNIEDDDWEVAYKIVDSFFENSAQSLQMDVCKKIQIHQISCENIHLIMQALNRMTEEARKKKLKKEAFYREWKNVFEAHERLMFYIAEKYSAQY